MICRIPEVKHDWGLSRPEKRRTGPAPAHGQNDDEVGKCTTDFQRSPLQDQNRKRDTKSDHKSNQSMDKLQRRPRFKEDDDESTKNDSTFYPSKKAEKHARKQQRSESVAPNNRRLNSKHVKPSPASIIPPTSEKQ